MFVEGLEPRARHADPQQYARAQTTLRRLLGDVRVEAANEDGSKRLDSSSAAPRRRVRVAVLEGGPRTLLRVSGAEDIDGSGGPALALSGER